MQVPRICNYLKQRQHFSSEPIVQCTIASTHVRDGYTNTFVYFIIVVHFHLHVTALMSIYTYVFVCTPKPFV